MSEKKESKLTDSYQVQQRLNAMVSQDSLPVASSADVLQSLKLIQFFEDQDSKDSDWGNTEVGWLAKQELQYLKGGIRAIKSSQLLRNQFGSDLTGATAVASLLKKQVAQQVYNDVLDFHAKSVLENAPNKMPVEFKKNFYGTESVRWR